MYKYGFPLLLLISTLLSVYLFLDDSKLFGFSKVQKPLKVNNNTLELPRNGLGKPKYIWIIADAYAAFQTGDLKDYSGHGSFYHIKNKGYPQSSAIVSTQFLSRNNNQELLAIMQEDT